jgi:hypothetical protein
MKNIFLSIVLSSGMMFTHAQDLKNFQDPATKLYGLKDKAGKVVVEPQFKAVSYVNDGMAAVKLNDKWGYIDIKGQLVIPAQFDDAGSFSEGMAAVAKHVRESNGYIKATEWGYIDKTGKLKIEHRYNTTSLFKNGYAIVGYKLGIGNYLSGAIDITGKEAIPVVYSALEDKTEGLFLAAKGNVNNYAGKWGFLDSTNKVVIPFVYDGGMGFYEGLAAVKKEGKYGFIDKKGEVVIPFQFDGPSYFIKGKAEIQKDGVAYFINKKGVKVSK